MYPLFQCYAMEGYVTFSMVRISRNHNHDWLVKIFCDDYFLGCPCTNFGSGVNYTNISFSYL